MQPDLYLLFEFDHYYPQGGFFDFTGVYPSLEEAKASYTGDGGEAAHIVLLRDGKLTLLETGWCNTGMTPRKAVWKQAD